MKYVVVVKNHGSKKELDELDLAQPVTQSGAAVVLYLVHVATKTTLNVFRPPAKRVAVKQALTLANKAKKITVLDVKTTGKTAEVAKFLADNNFTRKTLIVVDEKTPELIRASKNIQNVLVVRATYLSVYHILNADHIVIAPSAVKTIETWLTGKGGKVI